MEGNNWYAYVNNDPVNWVDSWGLSAVDTKIAELGPKPFQPIPAEAERNMPKQLLIIAILLVVISSVSAQTDTSTKQTAIEQLLGQGFKTEINREGFHPFVPAFLFDSYITISKGRNINCNYFYDWIDGNILYEIVFLSTEYANNCVVAYILEEGSYERWRESNEGGGWAMRAIENDPRYGQHAGKTYIITEPFYKVNENDEPATVFINMDLDGDGIVQDGEGRLMWF